ncbi:MAG: hypothetical protein M1816_001674 [Peltula sp. TS41687]|nr:MAG: hypothetical protein M1816_001674 [Peltula sp. TS41687]
MALSVYDARSSTRPSTNVDEAIPTGIKVLYDGGQGTDSSSTVDIVAIHGIGAHPDKTWCKKVGEQYVNWLADRNMLPAAVSNTRIMRYGYESKWFGENVIRQTVSDLAPRLLRSLIRKRKECPLRPLVFIAHGFGGLVVLKALEKAQRKEAEEHDIFKCTIGIAFLGTPFRGAQGMDQRKLLEAAVVRQYLEQGMVEEQILQILKPGSETLVDVVDTFLEDRSVKSRVQLIVCFYELKSCDVGRIVKENWPQSLVVDKNSGCLDLSESIKKYALERNHFNINKFGSPDEEDFKLLSEEIEAMVKRAHELLQARLKSDKAIRTFYEVPPIHVSHFIGREALLKEIDSVFKMSPNHPLRPSILVLQDLGGQGKTQIALESCRRAVDARTFRGIIWIDAASKMTAERGFQNIAAKLNKLIRRDLEDIDAEIKFVKEILQGWDEPWMLVFDNYDRLDEFRDVKRFLPIKQGIADNTPEGSKIVERLRGLALAIDQAAAYIKYKKLALTHFLPRYEAERKKILQYTPKHFWEYQKIEDGSEQEKAISAFTTWEMSFRQIQPPESGEKADVEHFLTLSAFLDSSNLGEYLFACYQLRADPLPQWTRIFSYKDTEESSDEEDLSLDENESNEADNGALNSSGADATHQQALTTARALDDRGVTFSLHPLIADWLQLRVKSKIRRSYILEASNLLTIILHSFDKVDLSLQWKLELLAHMDTCLSNDRQDSGTCSILCDNSLGGCAFSFGRFYRAQGRYKSVEDLFRPILLALTKELGQGHQDTLNAMSHLALTYMSQGRWNEAEELQKQVLEMRKSILGEKHPDTLTSMNNLAWSYGSQGHLNEAEELQKQVLEMRKSILGEKHPATLTIMSWLAYNYWNQGRYQEAEQFQVEILNSRRIVLGETHPDTLNSMKRLAKIYRSQSRYDEAIKGGSETQSDRLSRTDHPPDVSATTLEEDLEARLLNLNVQDNPDDAGPLFSALHRRHSVSSPMP